MAGGLAALLDDIAAFAKLAAASVDDVGAAAAKASAKAAGVVVDDTAVTPRYVHGFTADRELPVVRRIATGSIRNKLLIILPVILLLSELLPWLLTPILMLGGAYLCYEGAEKIWEKISHHEGHEVPAAMVGQQDEDTMVRGAIRTDLILSAEIMVIALDSVAEEPLLTRAAVLVVVAFAITALVYGVVALIVKMDDIGLSLAQRPSPRAQREGLALVKAMPMVLAFLCSGSAGTSSSTASRSWASPGCPTRCTTSRSWCARPPAPSAACWPGSPTPSPRPCSASRSERWSCCS